MDPARARRLIVAAAFLRSLATGTVAILIGIHLKRLGLDTGELGLVIGAGLAGNALAALVATARGDVWGRRRTLAALGLLGALGGVWVAFAKAPAVLALAAFVGMLNGMGRERGAALILEQAILPGFGTHEDRTRAFAWYNVLCDVGHGLGAVLAALPELLRNEGIDDLAAMRSALVLCALCWAATIPLSASLPRAAEAAHPGTRAPLTPGTVSIVKKVSALFAIDALGGGFLTTAWLSYYFFEHFEVGEVAVAALFVAARVANALSHLGAAWLARRIGLVNTMVFTHVPSSLLLLTMLVAPSFPVAALLLVLREGLSQMDVPTRQSYVMAVVRPEERLTVSGITQLVRLGAWALAPLGVWLLPAGAPLAVPIAIGAGLKIAYDGLLWAAFHGLRPPEERVNPGAAPSAPASAPIPEK